MNKIAPGAVLIVGIIALLVVGSMALFRILGMWNTDEVRVVYEIPGTQKSVSVDPLVGWETEVESDESHLSIRNTVFSDDGTETSEIDEATTMIRLSVAPTTVATIEAFLSADNELSRAAQSDQGRRTITVDGVDGIAYHYTYRAYSGEATVFIYDGYIYSLTLLAQTPEIKDTYYAQYVAFVKSLKF